MSEGTVELLQHDELPEGALEQMRLAQNDFELLARVAGELGEQHPGRWVGVHHGEIIGPKSTSEASLETLKARNIPTGHTVTFRLTPKDEIWILPAV